MRHTVRVEDTPETRSGPELDPVGAWGLVVSLVLGGVAAVLSLVAYLVDLPSWLVGVCLPRPSGGSPPPSSPHAWHASSRGPPGVSCGRR